MANVEKHVIELTHSYNKPVDIDDRTFLIAPKEFRSPKKMYELLCFIMFTVWELYPDNPSVDPSECLETILKNCYGFTNVYGWVMDFTGYDTYVIWEAGCGSFDVNKYKSVYGLVDGILEKEIKLYYDECLEEN